MPDPTIRDDIQRAFEQVQKAEESLNSFDRTLADSQPSTPQEVRWHVTRIAVSLWAGFVAALGLFVIFGGSCATPEKISDLTEIIKIGILPIVTFAIGHYFGSKSE